MTQLVELEGFFIQNYKRFKFLMKFKFSNNKIKGEISDNFGNSSISGYTTNSEMKLLKSYYSGLSEGGYFIYNGNYNSSKNKVIGYWFQNYYPCNHNKFWLKLPEIGLFFDLL